MNTNGLSPQLITVLALRTRRARCLRRLVAVRVQLAADACRLPRIAAKLTRWAVAAACGRVLSDLLAVLARLA